MVTEKMLIASRRRKARKLISGVKRRRKTLMSGRKRKVKKLIGGVKRRRRKFINKGISPSI